MNRAPCPNRWSSGITVILDYCQGLHNSRHPHPGGLQSNEGFCQTVSGWTPLVYYLRHYAPLGRHLLSSGSISINKYSAGTKARWKWQGFSHSKPSWKRGASGRPILSEFGAGLSMGRTRLKQKWSENFRRSTWTTLSTPPAPGGRRHIHLAVRDIRTARAGTGRPPRQQQGCREYRKPKQAYWTVRKLYTEAQS